MGVWLLSCLGSNLSGYGHLFGLFQKEEMALVKDLIVLLKTILLPKVKRKSKYACVKASENYLFYFKMGNSFL